jgi:RNA polymerase sigma-70 factor (ECF subfamily)
MKTTSLVPAVLLLTLSAPSLSSAATSAQRTRTRTATSTLDVKRDALSPANIAQTGDYLRDPATASPDAQLAWSAFQPAADTTIRAFAGRFFKSASDIDDCTQEVWIDLIRNLPDFNLDQSRGRFTSWLFTIVRNKATDIVRRQARRAEPMTAAIDHPDRATEDPAHSLARKSEIQSVHAALAALRERTSEKNYQLLHLRHIEGRPVAEVAEVLNITPSQVWAREHRLKRQLRALLTAQADAA